MSDGDLPTDDEIVSAYLDGEATPAEVARVEREPVLQARLAQFQAGSARVADVSQPDVAARDEHLRQAREAFGQPDTPRASVHSLDTARRRRTRAVILSAAAVVACLVLGAGLLPRLFDNGDADLTAADTSADRQLESAEAPSADAGGSDTDAPGEASGGPTTSADDQAGVGTFAPAPPALGSFATRGDLDRALLAVLDAELAAQLTTRGSVVPSTPGAPGAPDGPAGPSALARSNCAASVLDDDPEVLDLAYVASAELAGRAVEVLAFWTDPAASVNGLLRVYLVDPSTCRPIADGVKTLG